MQLKCLFTALFAVLSAVSPARGDTYRWPLDAERRLSSAFGEYRDGHYHAGIDLRTYGQIGLPCRAIDRCEATRIRVSPAGYGKALYVRLRDGRTAVYAHLAGFSRGLDSLVYHWRLERGRGTCDIEIEPGTFAFEAGDTVAYSGNTGSPHPHLHFEMRDYAGKPVNPLESFYDVPDECAPVVLGLEVVPLSWGSLVNGSPMPFTGHFRLTKGNLYALADTLRLDGSFGFGVSAFDKQLRGSYRMGPYTVELIIDGAPAYRVRHSSFDYAQANDISLEYDERNGGAPGRYFVLYEKPANTMSGREGSGVVSSGLPWARESVPGPGLHRGEIVVRDVKGNEARGVFHFILHANPEAAISRSSPDAPRIAIDPVDPDGGTVSVALSVSGDGGASWRDVSLERAGQGYAGAAPADPGALYRCVLRDDEGASIERYLAWPPLRGERDSVLCDVRPEIRAEGLYLRIKTDWPLAADPSVRLAGGTAGDSLRVFSLGPRESVVFVPAGRIASGVTLIGIRGRDARGFLLDAVRGFQIYALETGEWVSFDAADGVAMQLRAPSVRGRAAVLVRDAGVSSAHQAGLEAMTPPFSIEFAPASFSRWLQCGFESGGNAGLYRWDGERAGWGCVGVPGGVGGTVQLRRPGVYAVMRDTRSPELKKLSSVRGSPGSGFFKSRLSYVSVVEDGSGIDPESGAAFLDGVRVVCEWDEYRARLEIPIPRSRRPGPATLRVEIADLAGNKAAGEFSFVIE